MVEVAEMKEIVKYKGLTLIKKYEQYYIRFIGGQHEQHLCDLRITDNEALSIISNNKEIKKIRDSYKSKVPWTKEYFETTAIKDYLIYMSKSMGWKYVKQLSSEESIEAFERLVNYAFPKNFKDCVKQYNGARPKYRVFDTDKKTGRELKSLLSFNREDKETVWDIYEWSKTEHQGKYIPFAIDNFGNLICFDRTGKIVFINHETLELEVVASSFEEFIGGLYMSATYYKDDNTGNIVRHIQGYGVEQLNKDSLVWENCGANSNYYREIFLGEGNNCLSPIPRNISMI